MIAVRVSLLTFAAAAMLGGCDAPSRTRAQSVAAEDLSACRARADEIYNKQNRAAVYNSDVFDNDTKDAPYATSGLADVPSNGLSTLFEHDNLVSNCVNSRNAGAAGGEPSGPAAATATPQSTQ